MHIKKNTTFFALVDVVLQMVYVWGVDRGAYGVCKLIQLGRYHNAAL